VDAVINGSKSLKEPIVWVDLEMTGLDVNSCTIMEIAVIVTDGALNVSIEGPEIAIHHSEEALASMNEWCIEHHGKSGLTQRCRESRVTLAEAEQRVLEFVQKYTKEKWAPLAGNSIHCDRQFLEVSWLKNALQISSLADGSDCLLQKYMPKLTDHLHYRIIDVTSVKELCKRWYKKDFTQMPRKVLAHTALSDIRESIQELRYYQQVCVCCLPFALHSNLTLNLLLSEYFQEEIVRIEKKTSKKIR
jgi:oligoribonuclease